MSFSSWCLIQNFRGINWGSVWPFIVMNRINMLFQTTFLSRIVITNCAPKIFLIFMNCCYMLFQITFFQSQMEQFYVFWGLIIRFIYYIQDDSIKIVFSQNKQACVWVFLSWTDSKCLFKLPFWKNFRDINWEYISPLIILNCFNLPFQIPFLSRIVITKCALEGVLILMNWCHVLFQVTFLLKSAVTNWAILWLFTQEQIQITYPILFFQKELWKHKF